MLVFKEGVTYDPCSKDTQHFEKRVVDVKAINAQMTGGSPEPVEAGGNHEYIIDEREQQDRHDNHAMLDIMKHTPENGSLPISYPNDHIASLGKKQRDKDNAQPNIGDDEETQMSQDLLAASPARFSKDGSSGKASSQMQASPSNDGNVLKDPPARPEVDSSLARTSKNVNEENGEGNSSRNDNVAEKETSTTPWE